MAENWILNASPLIPLSRIGHEELLLAQADQVVVPRAGLTEIQAGPPQDQARAIKSLPDGYTIFCRALDTTSILICVEICRKII